MATSNRHLTQTVARLKGRSDADSLAAAALLSATQDRSQALALLTQAKTTAPERPDLVWLYIGMCGDVTACDPKPEELALRRMSPTNGAGWLGELTRAVAAHDEAGRDAALMAIGHTERFDIYWTTLIGHLSTAAARAGRMSNAETISTVIGVVAAVAIPPFLPASNSCRGDRLQRPDILEACQGVAAAFENGDTQIVEMMGVNIATRVWPEGSAEWQSAAERRRVFEHRMELGKSLPLPWSEPQAQRYLSYYFQQPREQDVWRAQLLDAGQAP